MAPISKTLTEYERNRLDNFRRNEEMMSAQMLQRKAADLKPEPKPYPKKRKAIVIRRSLRTRGMPPSSDEDPPRKRGPLLVAEAFVSGPNDDSGAVLVEAIKSSSWAESGAGSVKSQSFDARSDLVLRPGNVARVVSERILSIRFLPIGIGPWSPSGIILEI